MKRATLVTALLLTVAQTSLSTVEMYPRLTRETLVGVWEGLFIMDTVSTVLHIDIAPNDRQSYLVEITAGQPAGSLFHLQKCTLDEGKLRLEFRAPDGREWWIYGEGYATREKGVIRANFGTGFNAKRT